MAKLIITILSKRPYKKKKIIDKLHMQPMVIEPMTLPFIPFLWGKCYFSYTNAITTHNLFFCFCCIKTPDNLVSS